MTWRCHLCSHRVLVAAGIDQPPALSFKWRPCMIQQSASAVVSRWWQYFDRADFANAIGLMAPGATIEWPLSGERISDPGVWKTIQEHYLGAWSSETTFAMEDSGQVSTITSVTSESESDLALSIFTVSEGAITNLIQYWSSTYPPAA
jgi:hypothetical protein